METVPSTEALPTAIALLSGGLDSATAAALAQAEGYRVIGLSFDYGQRHRRELQAAAAVAQALGLAEHHSINVNLAAWGGSALTDTAMEVPNAGVQDGVIPSTYVPGRNTVFISIGLSLAEARGQVAGEVSGFDPGERPLAGPWSAAHRLRARQVGAPGLDQGRIANAAAVADAAWVLAAAVATPGLLNRHPQAQRLLDDLGFAPLHQGRPELGAMALSAGLAGQVRQGLEGAEVIRAAVRVAGVVDRIDPQHQAFGAAGLRQAEADADEHRVAPRDVGARDHAVLHPRVGNLHGGVRQGGATPGRQVDADAVVFGQAQGLRNRGGGLEFAPMALAVVKGEADDAVALRLGEGGGGGGIQPSGEQGDGGGQGFGVGHRLHDADWRC